VEAVAVALPVAVQVAQVVVEMAKSTPVALLQVLQILVAVAVAITTIQAHQEQVVQV
jgi:hypothetical protein